MARGVQLQAVSDDGSLNFDVYIFNVQPGVSFDYATANAKALKGFRFGGPAKLYTDGPYYEQAKEWATGKFPVPKAAGIITIEKIWTLDPGPKAGKIFEE